MKSKATADLRWLLALAVIISLAWCLITCVVHAGFNATPAGATDSNGRTMGFNDRLSAEHYMIMIRSFRLNRMFTAEYGYAWLLIGAHIYALVALLRSGQKGEECKPCVFWVQNLLFPVGWLGWLVLPPTLHEIVSGTASGETIVDIPFVACIGQPVWVLTSSIAGGVLTRARRKAADSMGLELQME
jgi:hypothetical protein